MAEQRPEHTGWLLDRYWDELQIDARRSSPPSDLDPLLAATADDLHRRDDALASDRDFADHLWRELMNPPSIDRPNHRFTATHPTSQPALPGPPVNEEPSSRAHRWPAGVFPTAALIVLTLAVAVFAYRLPGAPAGHDEPTFGAQGNRGNGPLDGHPLVGSWVVFPTDGHEREDAPVMMTFGGDGTIVATALNRNGPDRLGHGAWAPDGETGARFAYRTTDSTTDPAFDGRNSVAGTSEFDATGDAWTGIYRIAEPESGQGQAAPSPRTTIEAIRINVAPESFTDPDAGTE